MKERIITKARNENIELKSNNNRIIYLIIIEIVILACSILLKTSILGIISIIVIVFFIIMSFWSIKIEANKIIIKRPFRRKERIDLKDLIDINYDKAKWYDLLFNLSVLFLGANLRSAETIEILTSNVDDEYKEKNIYLYIYYLKNNKVKRIVLSIKSMKKIEIDYLINFFKRLDLKSDFKYENKEDEGYTLVRSNEENNRVIEIVKQELEEINQDEKWFKEFKRKMGKGFIYIMLGLCFIGIICVFVLMIISVLNK